MESFNLVGESGPEKVRLPEVVILNPFGEEMPRVELGALPMAHSICYDEEKRIPCTSRVVESGPITLKSPTVAISGDGPDIFDALEQEAALLGRPSPIRYERRDPSEMPAIKPDYVVQSPTPLGQRKVGEKGGNAMYIGGGAILLILFILLLIWIF